MFQKLIVGFREQLQQLSKPETFPHLYSCVFLRKQIKHLTQGYNGSDSAGNQTRPVT